MQSSEVCACVCVHVCVCLRACLLIYHSMWLMPHCLLKNCSYCVFASVYLSYMCVYVNMCVYLWCACACVPVMCMWVCVYLLCVCVCVSQLIYTDCALWAESSRWVARWTLWLGSTCWMERNTSLSWRAWETKPSSDCGRSCLGQKTQVLTTDRWCLPTPLNHGTVERCWQSLPLDHGTAERWFMVP